MGGPRRRGVAPCSACTPWPKPPLGGCSKPSRAIRMREFELDALVQAHQSAGPCRAPVRRSRPAPARSGRAATAAAGARLPCATGPGPASGGNTPALIHLGLDGLGFGDGILSVRSGLVFNELARVLLAERLAQIQGTVASCAPAAPAASVSGR